MNIKQNNWPTWALMTLALLGLVGLAQGQGEMMADLVRVQAASGEYRKALPGPDVSASAVRITDDGRRGDGLPVASQLVFAFDDIGPRELAVDVLDEQGRVVLRRMLRSKQGRNALAMDVGGLREGRYAARIAAGESVRVVRFRR